mmetsp:Transcript_62880/g.148945  ORF Transcript_62880/g.148945 Transcript_62880/m.148945 type:complete len:120 (-) Transcript_62880:150-509(-)
MVQAVMELTEGRGVDVILDVDGDGLDANLNALCSDGRLILLGPVGETTTAHMNIRKLMEKRVALHGANLRAEPCSVVAEIVAGMRDKLWPSLNIPGPLTDPIRSSVARARRLIVLTGAP